PPVIFGGEQGLGESAQRRAIPANPCPRPAHGMSLTDVSMKPKRYRSYLPFRCSPSRSSCTQMFAGVVQHPLRKQRWFDSDGGVYHSAVPRGPASTRITITALITCWPGGRATSLAVTWP